MTCKACEPYGTPCDGELLEIRLRDGTVLEMCEGAFRFHEPWIALLDGEVGSQSG